MLIVFWELNSALTKGTHWFGTMTNMVGFLYVVPTKLQRCLAVRWGLQALRKRGGLSGNPKLSQQFCYSTNAYLMRLRGVRVEGMCSSYLGALE
ncbi:UNVERIFIED_CONTAM: hypothetical protein Slati_3853500 [Sesamum latifolium]|uniref:Uncharacterized protein n=1 Tax=Sesamum latifolium TaxID=2727402 RepID=A0AAW2TKV3_9LAMI